MWRDRTKRSTPPGRRTRPLRVRSDDAFATARPSLGPSLEPLLFHNGGHFRTSTWHPERTVTPTGSTRVPDAGCESRTLERLMNDAHRAAKLSYVRRERDAIAAMVGLAVLGLGMLAVRNGSVSGFEESVFRAINDLPGVLYPVLWPFQQLGAVLVGPLVAVIALILRRYRLAIAALLVTVAKLLLERAVKVVVSRQRPATSIGLDVHRRGDVSVTGEAFVSGHAWLVAALAMVIQPYLRGRWQIVPWVVVALVMITRVYVGAHNPLDVIAGGALGVAIGGLINIVVGV